MGVHPAKWLPLGCVRSSGAKAYSPGSQPSLSCRPHGPFRFLPAVCHLLQRRALLLRLLLPVPHLRHPRHHHPAGALQEPELRQELGREERGAAAVDQRAAPQLFPHLPGAACPQHPPRSHRLRPPGDARHLERRCSHAASRSVMGQRTAPTSGVPSRSTQTRVASTVPDQSRRQTAASRWQSWWASGFQAGVLALRR